jgi:hypothetical protein
MCTILYLPKITEDDKTFIRKSILIICIEELSRKLIQENLEL